MPSSSCRGGICLFLASLTTACAPTLAVDVPSSPEVRPQTFCNPLDLAYRFQPHHSWRVAADPVIVSFKDAYWLFASQSGGYWTSTDLAHWDLIEPVGLPMEPDAPAVTVINGKLLYTCSFSNLGTFTTANPISGKSET